MAVEHFQQCLSLATGGNKRNRICCWNERVMQKRAKIVEHYKDLPGMYVKENWKN